MPKLGTHGDEQHTHKRKSLLWQPRAQLQTSRASPAQRTRQNAPKACACFNLGSTDTDRHTGQDAHKSASRSTAITVWTVFVPSDSPHDDFAHHTRDSCPIAMRFAPTESHMRFVKKVRAGTAVTIGVRLSPCHFSVESKAMHSTAVDRIRQLHVQGVGSNAALDSATSTQCVARQHAPNP